MAKMITKSAAVFPAVRAHRYDGSAGTYYTPVSYTHLTTISESAVDTRNQIASNVASSANPTHKAERAHVFIMDPNSFSFI